MKSLHGVLCAALISAISLPMFGMEGRVAMDENEVARRLREIAIIDTCRHVGGTICGIGCPLVACCCTRDLEVSVNFVLIGVAVGEGAGLLVAGLKIHHEEKCAAEGDKKND